MPDQRGYTVFEIVNEKRLEIYVGVTRDPIAQMIETIRRRRPDSIRHWNLDEAGAVRSIESDMGEKDARAFIENYVKTSVADGWRFLT